MSWPTPKRSATVYSHHVSCNLQGNLKILMYNLYIIIQHLYPLRNTPFSILYFNFESLTSSIIRKLVFTKNSIYIIIIHYYLNKVKP